MNTDIKRINVGSGRRHLGGYTTIDIESKNNPDIVGDFREMKFENLDEILAEHILEHFSRDEGMVVISQWREWLKPKGILIIETPDFEKICEGFSKLDKNGRYWFTRHVYGSQEAEWAFHRDGWYEEKFRYVLKELGFDVVNINRNVTHGNLPNIRVSAIKSNFP